MKGDTRDYLNGLQKENAGLREYADSRDQSITVYRQEIEELKNKLIKQDIDFVNKTKSWEAISIELMKEVDAEREKVRELKEDNVYLRAWKQDVCDAQKMIMEERCPTDEIHCTCVPLLRLRVRELEEALRRIIEEVYGWEVNDVECEGCKISGRIAREALAHPEPDKGNKYEN